MTNTKKTKATVKEFIVNNKDLYQSLLKEEKNRILKDTNKKIAMEQVKQENFDFHDLLLTEIELTDIQLSSIKRTFIDRLIINIIDSHISTDNKAEYEQKIQYLKPIIDNLADYRKVISTEYELIEDNLKKDYQFYLDMSKKPILDSNNKYILTVLKRILSRLDRILIDSRCYKPVLHTQKKSETKTVKQDNLFQDEKYKEYSLKKLSDKNSFKDYFEIKEADFLSGFILNSGNNNLNKQGYYQSLQLFIESSSDLYNKIYDNLINATDKKFGNKLKFSFEYFRYNKSKNCFEISNELKAI